MLAKAAKKLDVQREVTRLTRYPAAGMMVRQLLFFDDKKKACEDYWIFKSAKQWEEDEALTRQQVRTANKKLEEFGLVQIDRDRPDPLYNNKTTFYRLNIYRVMQLVDPMKLESLEPELRYLEPEYEIEDDCERCGDDFCFCEWASDEDDVEGGVTEDASSFTNQPLLENQPTPMTESTNPLVDLTNPMYRGTTTEELPQKNYEQKNSTFQVGEGRFRALSPEVDFQEQEQPRATSPPTQQDPPRSNKAGEVTPVQTSRQTTKPTRKAVRALLEKDGALHDMVEDAVGYGKEGPPLLAKQVARKLGGDADDYVEPVKVALMEMWRTEREVA